MNNTVNGITFTNRGAAIEYQKSLSKDGQQSQIIPVKNGFVVTTTKNNQNRDNSNNNNQNGILQRQYEIWANKQTLPISNQASTDWYTAHGQKSQFIEMKTPDQYIRDKFGSELGVRAILPQSTNSVSELKSTK